MEDKDEPRKVISKLIPDKDRPVKIHIKEAMREELRMHSKTVRDTNMKTVSLISGYLMALGHEEHNCTIDANFEFLTLIKKENKENG